MATRQPFLHDAEVVLEAPAQAWSRADGGMRAPIDGVFAGDVRVLRGLRVEVAGSTAEHVATERRDAATARFTALLRGLDGAGADPRVRLETTREVHPGGVTDRLVVVSARDVPVPLEVTVVLLPDATPMPEVKAGVTAGAPGAAPVLTRTPDGVSWSAEEVESSLVADGWSAEVDAGAVRLRLATVLAPGGGAEASWTIRTRDRAAVVAAPVARIPLSAPPTGEPDLDAWTTAALSDLEALQLSLPATPGDVFVGAGAPWFLTLFGRDAIWTARMLLPLGADLARGTLRVLAAQQGRRTDAATGEEPGGILHELRRAENAVAGGPVLPPRYYGTVDATPLWAVLLHDAWRAGLADEDVLALLPALRAAMSRLAAAVPVDGFLAYADAHGRGLANQGWKDSGDSIQWADGRLAEAPIALCEVQGYAHEAALAAAVLLEAFGAPEEASRWRSWAAALAARFRSAFWVDDERGGHPAVALDAGGRAVDSLTSNIGHLLGTGILDAADERRVADLLVDPRLDSGAGLRTLATDAAGYWPLSYHGGSVWPHDTAIAVHGLLRAGFPDQARTLATGLVAAARAFGWRMPELYSGDPGAPIPYPAACRPQAWSAAAAVVARSALRPDPTPARAAAHRPLQHRPLQRGT